MARHVLVVTTASVSDGALREHVRAHTEGEPAAVRIVAPASDLSRLAWLASAEDDARAQAEERAQRLATAVAPVAETSEAGVGDADPVQAIEDALRTFPADELVLVTHPKDKASWLEEGAPAEAFAVFKLPITHLVVDED